jgi:hypothetical protein
LGLIDSIIGAESGGNPNAQNSNSSASGPGQFIDSTWLSTIKSARPDLAQGKSDAELLALKTDPDLGRQMTEAYANQNQAILSKNGLPVTPGTTYLAHFAGPQGAVKVLQADPNASVEDVLGSSVVKANPFLKGMTTQGLQAWAAKKMGTEAPQTAPAPQAQPASPASPANAIPQQVQAPIFAPSPQAAPSAPIAPFQQIPQAPLPQINFAQHRPVDLSTLRAYLSRNS